MISSKRDQFGMEDSSSAGAYEIGPRCPSCGWNDTRRSMPRGILDRFTRIVGLVPYRCRSCGGRFYRTLR